MKPRVTQKDVARKAGISSMAVSLALRDHHSIPPRTREHIKKIARQLGYSPDPMLSSLTAYRLSQRPPAYQSNIAWINTWKKPEKMHVGAFGQYFLSASERAKELGYQLEEFRLNNFNRDPKRLQKTLLTRGIKGILLPPAEFAGDELLMDFSPFSAVRFGYSWRYPVLLTITNAQFRTTLNMVKNLVDLGYQRIGLHLSREMNDRTGWNFIGGFAAGQQFMSPRNRLAPFFSNKGDIPLLASWIRKMKLDALISLGCWEDFSKTKNHIAYADISVPLNEPLLTGMYQNNRLIGRTAVDSLTAMMHRGETGIPEEYHHQLIESIWIPGKTAPPVNL